jgi:hypothetical protein
MLSLEAMIVQHLLNPAFPIFAASIFVGVLRPFLLETHLYSQILGLALPRTAFKNSIDFPIHSAKERGASKLFLFRNTFAMVGFEASHSGRGFVRRCNI